jgi:hypothetical protein
VGALSALAFAGTAGADITGGSQVSVAVPISPDPTSGQAVAPGTPFSSGQTISIQVPANTLLTPHANVVIVECAAPNGVLPTLPSECDTGTVQGSSIIPATDGHFTYNQYQIFALPDATTLFETPTHTPVCSNTAATECVLYVGNNYNDFTAPHFFSEAFKITANADDQGENPGDGTPELPLAIGLPLAAAGIFGGVMYRRRHIARSAS